MKNASGGCDAWQQVNQGDYITPELVGQMILFVFLLCVLVYFLSRLCGGEDWLLAVSLCNHFLSRLCGGEASDYSTSRSTGFLSRLCGGEVIFLGCPALQWFSKPPMWR